MFNFNVTKLYVVWFNDVIALAWMMAMWTGQKILNIAHRVQYFGFFIHWIQYSNTEQGVMDLVWLNQKRKHGIIHTFLKNRAIWIDLFKIPFPKLYIIVITISLWDAQIMQVESSKWRMFSICCWKSLHHFLGAFEHCQWSKSHWNTLIH